MAEMLTVEQVKALVPNALVIFFFPQRDDRIVLFTTRINEQNALTGIDIMGIRGNAPPYFMDKSFLTELFQARLTKGKDHYQLALDPLDQPLSIWPRKDGSFKCMYQHQNKLWTVDKVVVTGQLHTMTLDFTIHLSFRTGAQGSNHAQVEKRAPKRWTEKLYHMNETDNAA